MNCRIARLIALASLAAVLLGTAAAAAPPNVVWPNYHGYNLDQGRRGQNLDVETGNPASMGPIWVFPRNEVSQVAETDSVVAPPDQQKNFREGLTANDAYGDRFFYKTVISYEEKDNKAEPDAWAYWFFPSKLQRGFYQIMVWVPTKYTSGNYSRNTTQAQYTVIDDNGSTTVTFDQTNGGGWVMLSSRYFSFNDPTKAPEAYQVVLSNLTGEPFKDIVDDPTAKNPVRNVIAVADAIRFVPVTGREIYTSPTSAEIYWDNGGKDITWKDPNPPDFAAGNETWTGKFGDSIPVVYLGTVEAAAASGTIIPDTGSVYCVNSITASHRKITDEAWHTDQTQYEDWKKANALAQFLGTNIWQYPRLPNDRTDELEGPIEGGVYATPTIISTGDATHPLVCVFAAMDRQVYCVDAQTGELLWKGPGLTRPERGPDGIGSLVEGPDATDWKAVTGDAFGGKFHSIRCEEDDSANIKTAGWRFDRQARQNAGEPATDADKGWTYAIYTWLPAMAPGEDTRVKDATYTIKNAMTGAELGKVTVDQSDPANHGRWVRLGSSYFFGGEDILVTVNNVTNPPDPVGPENAPPATDFHLVVDAMMIVPETIDSFSYASPVWNGKTGDAGRIYTASVSGRALGFKLKQDGDLTLKAGTTKWIFPAVRTVRSPQGEADMDKPALGQFSASPTFKAGGTQGDQLFMADFSGVLHCLTNLDSDTPTEQWAFPGSGSSESPECFTSSPAIDDKNPQILIGATNGVFYSINSDTGQLNWKYPEDVADPATTGDAFPLGAFRYSTAAIGDDSDGMHRAWVGSSDGTIYSFYIDEPANKTALRRIYTEWDDNGNLVANHIKYYVEPSAGAPIQGSIAIDKSDKSSGHPYMYVGDMQDRGALHWYRANSGVSDFHVTGTDAYGNAVNKYYKSYRLEGMLFSSPNITHTKVTNTSKTVSYVYVGASDGRLFAFSDEQGAWGGGWAGGDWPYGGGSPENDDRREEQISPNPDIQFEMINQTAWQNSQNIIKQLFEGSINNAGTQWTMASAAEWAKYSPWILSREMKQPTVDLSSKTNKEIDDALRDLAKKRRNASENIVFALDKRTGDSSNADNAIYFEWGETIYLAVWNLPAKRFLYGSGSGDSSIRANIRFNLTNTSSGSSAGTANPTVTVTDLQEYHVLTNKATTTTDGTYYEALKYTQAPLAGQDVMRSYALAQVQFRANVPRPPSPGPGWVLNVEIRKRASTSPTAPVTTITIPICRLKPGNPPEPLFIAHQSTDPNVNPGDVGDFRKQTIGVNNPLAIRDDHIENGLNLNAGDPDSIAWPGSSFSCADQRYNKEAHYNGNSAVVVDANNRITGFSNGKLPTMNLDNFNGTIDLGVAHGTNSREGKLGLMDRSAMGLTGSKIDTVRIDAGDLKWQGGDSAIEYSLKVMGMNKGVKFPWEFGLGSADYPDIPKRRQTYRKKSDETDPSRALTSLPGVIKAVTPDPNKDDYSNCTMRPDTVYMSVEVPKYQPANITKGSAISGPNSLFGYQKTMTAYVDSDRSGTWASGDQVMGRPVTYQEVYRKFRVGVRVPADPRIQVEEQLVDIGQPSHGLGEGLAASPAWNTFEFLPVNPQPDVQKWFKKITIKNAGNVNLYNLKLAKQWPDNTGTYRDIALRMVKDAASMSSTNRAIVSVPASGIVSSLDGILPTLDYLKPLVAEPFYTANYGYTLTKPRVGDPDPSVLTIPDKRKWDNNYGGTQTYSKAALKTALMDSGMTEAEADSKVAELLPYKTAVSVKIPVSQPIGTYQSPMIPIYADLYPEDGKFTFDANGSEPYAAPTFELKATVRESVMTGMRSSGCLPQIEVPMPSGIYPRVGDSTPAAYRDPVTGNVRLWWSSNRMFANNYALYPDWANDNDPRRKDFANAPWLLDQAELNWSTQAGAWMNAADRWWLMPTNNPSPFIPVFGNNKQWPDLLPIWGPGATVMPWEFDGKDTGFVSVRHYSPSIAFAQSAHEPCRLMNRTNGGLAWGVSNQTWLTWAGRANVLDGNGKAAQENCLFYVDVSGGLLDNARATITRVKCDPNSEKRHPSTLYLQDWVTGDDQKRHDRMWTFWQAADNDRWSVHFVTNDDIYPKDSAPTFPDTNWSAESSLATPNCLASVGSPNALYRVIADDVSQATHHDKNMLDVVYDGTTKLRQNSDVLLSRYVALTSLDGFSASILPNRTAQPMPRIYAEKLKRDPKFGFFTSDHLAWVRPNTTGIGKLAYFSAADVAKILADHCGAHHEPGENRKAHEQFTDWYDTIIGGVPASSRAGLYEFYNLPHVWVKLPKSYKVKGTDGKEEDLGGRVVSATHGVEPQFDAATSTLIYKYDPESDAAKVFGEMIADFSAGIIRFKNPISEKKAGDGSVLVPEVFADYTPQTWRLTTDEAVDNSPSSFIERTPMNSDANPGMSAWTGHPSMNSVDRLWVLWRKASTGVTSSTIFWKTYRIGIDLSNVLDKDDAKCKPVRWSYDGNGNPVVNPGDISVTDALGPWEIDRTGKRIYFTELDERYGSLLQTAARDYFVKDGPRAIDNGHFRPITIVYTNVDGEKQTVYATDISWIPETPERSLFGYATDSIVNEGSIYGFSDIGNPQQGGTFDPFLTSKTWVFWTSTRQGTSDLCWATLSPNFSAR
jgi:hypothetical protein